MRKILKRNNNSSAKIKKSSNVRKKINKGLIKKSKKIVEKKKSAVQKTRKPRLIITESKIKKLLNFEHIEELFHLLHILNDEQVELFIEHYKNQEREQLVDKKIDAMINKSRTKYELMNNLRAELINSLNLEYRDLKERISSLRKKGKDTYIEDIKVMSLPPKIKLFNATNDKQDFYKIKKITSEVSMSLDSLEKE
ncbi:hypothetical protein BMS3Abin17_00742 [archaeon BMS3Abin17]|nr:hypothetical protein BMS3Abin17_00742 [archaeon BMS3Abin17]HDZ60885.1 hypothetical protein [Candidatus Pacearchaeota archaeon]